MVCPVRGGQCTRSHGPSSRSSPSISSRQRPRGEEVLLTGLVVVERHRLPGSKPVEPDPEVVEVRVALAAEPCEQAHRAVAPLRVARVAANQPAVTGTPSSIRASGIACPPCARVLACVALFGTIWVASVGQFTVPRQEGKAPAPPRAARRRHGPPRWCSPRPQAPLHAPATDPPLAARFLSRAQRGRVDRAVVGDRAVDARRRYQPGVHGRLRPAGEDRDLLLGR